MWEVGIQQLGQKAVSGVIWGPGFGELSFWPWAKHISCSVILLFKSDLFQLVSEQLINIRRGFIILREPLDPQMLVHGTEVQI